MPAYAAMPEGAYYAYNYASIIRKCLLTDSTCIRNHLLHAFTFSNSSLKKGCS